MMLSVDPGNPCGWALWRDELSLAAYGLLDAADAGTITALLGRVLADARSCHLVVEDQWYRESEPVLDRMERGPLGDFRPVFRKRRTVGAGFDSVRKVIESRVHWEAACLIAGMSTELAPPSKWIPAMTKGHPEKTPRKRVHLVTQSRWPQLVGAITPDESAAILLGEWAIEERGGRARRRIGPTERFRGLEPARRRPKGDAPAA